MIKPLNDNILLKAFFKATQTDSGIILPTNGDEKLEKAEVIATGPNVTADVKPGDVVLFKDYITDEVEVDDQSYFFLKSEHILGIEEK